MGALLSLGGGEGEGEDSDQGRKGFTPAVLASSFSFSSRSFRASNLKRFLGARWRGEVEDLLFSFSGGEDGEEEGEEGDGDRDSEL